MKRALITSFALYIFIAISAQEIIDYSPKSLLSVLNKYADDEMPEIMEIEIPAALLNNNFIHGKYFSVEYKTAASMVSYIYIGRVNSCRAGGCSAPSETNGKEDSEFFDYFIIFDKEMAILNVKVYNYQATHGQEITSRGWLRQFTGFNGSQNLVVGKEIDGISGATISVYGITADIQVKSGMLRNIVQQ